MSLSPKALVLGGKTGLLGKALVSTLHETGWETFTAGPSRETPLKIETLSREIETLLDAINPEVVFNTIAHTQVDLAEEDTATAVFLNRTYPAMVARLLIGRDIRFVHYSTDFVFDGKASTPYDIDAETNPLSVYGSTKLEGEEAIMELDLPKFTIIRTAWLFGPGKKNFITTVDGLCKNRREINIVHDQVGSPTYTVDLAQYSLKLVEADVNGIFHIVNSGAASWCDFAGEAARLAGYACSVHPITSAEYPQKAQRPAYSVLDTSSFTKVTGIKPRPWPQALRDYIYRDILPE